MLQGFSRTTVGKILILQVVYNMDKSSEFRTEDFNEFFSQIGFIRSFQFLDSLNLNTTVGLGRHSSTIDSANDTRPEDMMDNWKSIH